jgi:hypothetical protein
MAKAAAKLSTGSPARHESFLRYAGFRWLWIASALSLMAIVAYILVGVRPRPNGGSIYGYTIGTVSALLVIWLTLLGLRKRAITTGAWSLKSWVSAHVYLGLSLVVLATLHTGFKFDWNIHTLAYGLMLLVITSGVVGVVLYVRLPTLLSANRGETTQRQMLEAVYAIDRQLDTAAQPLGAQDAAIVRMSVEHTNIGGGLLSRLTGKYPTCGNRRALRLLESRSSSDREAMEQIGDLLTRKAEILVTLRRHIQLRAQLEIWLKVHIPATFALLAALTVHIFSVFFYW